MFGGFGFKGSEFIYTLQKDRLYVKYIYIFCKSKHKKTLTLRSGFDFAVEGGFEPPRSG